jgi:hypothetical protein
VSGAAIEREVMVIPIAAVEPLAAFVSHYIRASGYPWEGARYEAINGMLVVLGAAAKRWPRGSFDELRADGLAVLEAHEKSFAGGAS